MSRLLLLLLTFPLSAGTAQDPGTPARNGAYHAAIMAYIRAIEKTDLAGFQTLYIGNHYVFPDVKVAPEIAGKKLVVLEGKPPTDFPRGKKGILLVNIVEEKMLGTEAGFKFITFNTEMRPLHMCLVNVRLDRAKRAWVMNGVPGFEGMLKSARN